MGIRLTIALAFIGILQAEEPMRGAKGRLISDASTIEPGVPFTVGLHLQHEPGFHSYWRNPGIVGIATDLQWILPEGFTASSIRWPFPERTTMAIHPCHGYRRDVTFLVIITPPAKLPSQSVTLKANARWMACSEQCYPQFHDLEISFPRQADAREASLIQQATAEIPKKSPHWKIHLLSPHDTSPIRLRLTGPATTPPTYLFSTDGQISSDQSQTFTSSQPGIWDFTITRAEFSPKGRKTLEAIIQCDKKHFRAIARYP